MVLLQEIRGSVDMMLKLVIRVHQVSVDTRVSAAQMVPRVIQDLMHRQDTQDIVGCQEKVELQEKAGYREKVECRVIRDSMLRRDIQVLQDTAVCLERLDLPATVEPLIKGLP